MSEIGENICDQISDFFIVHALLKLRAVEFVDNLVVEKDTRGDFGKPEWLMSRHEQWPLLYVRNNTIELKCKFTVFYAPQATESVEIRGSTTLDGQKLEWTSTVSVSPSDTEVTTPNMTSSGTLPNKVGCHDTMEIEWEFNPAGTGWSSAGSSNNLTYVLLGSPAGGVPHYWTLLDLSCRGAHGKNSENDTVTYAYDPLTRTKGDGHGPRRMRDGILLSYYNKAWDSSQVYTTAEMLSSSDGSGRCGAWARFFEDMCKLHGVTSTKLISVVPDFKPTAATVFLVKNHSFTGPGAFPPPYTHLGLTECTKTTGAAGQGKTNPQAIFGDHALVGHNAQIYDPSYGTGPFTSHRNWESASLDGLGRGAIYTYPFGGDTHALTQSCARGFVGHIVRPGETLSDIATRCGLGSAETLFSDPLNVRLRAKRGGPSDVVPGDTVIIPHAGSNVLMLTWS